MQQPISFAPSAQAGSDGTATFIVPSVPISQTWIGTLSIPGAPSSAGFSAQIGGLSAGNWIGQNTFGPVTIPQNLNLEVMATSLTPGDSYQLNFQGTVYTSEEALPAFAFPAATPTTQQTLQTMNLLGTGVASTSGESVTITIDPTWRSIWVILNPDLLNVAATAGITPTLQGTTTLNYFEGLQPPYLSTNTPTWAFTRFPLIYGPDTEVTLSIPAVNVITAGSTFWYGYDTQPVDIAVYDESVAITSTVVQPTASLLNATVVQPTAANLNARVSQPTASSLQAQVSQPTASSLNATVVQATAANLNATVSQSTPANLQVTANQATAANLNATVVQGTGVNLLNQIRQTFTYLGLPIWANVPTISTGGLTRITQAATASRVALLTAPVGALRLHSLSVTGSTTATNYCQLYDASSGGNLLAQIYATSSTIVLDGLSTTTGVWLIANTTGMTVTLSYDAVPSYNYTVL